MSLLHISNSTQNSTNCPKLVIIHITKRHSFIVLYSLHSLYPSVYAYINMRITMVMLLRHTGHVAITATRFAQLLQKRACPQGTSANPSRGATKHITGGVCGSICRSVWSRGRRSWCSCRRLAGISVVVVVVVVTVYVRRLQRSRVSAHGMTNGTKELESRIRPVVELGQTGLDSWLDHDVSFAFRATEWKSSQGMKFCNLSSVSCPHIVRQCPVLQCPVRQCPVRHCPVLQCPVLQFQRSYSSKSVSRTFLTHVYLVPFEDESIRVGWSKFGQDVWCVKKKRISMSRWGRKFHNIFSRFVADHVCQTDRELRLLAKA